MRISSIDIGSNAIRQIIVEIQPDGGWKILKKHREPIRLGSDVFGVGYIRNQTLERLVLAFKRMTKNSKKHKVDKSLALATSAFRDAKNKKLILAAVYRRTKVKIKVISGKKEAELIRKAVQNALSENPQNSLLIDIGGGSVELTHLENKKIHYSKSFKWGMVRTLLQAQKLSCKGTKVISDNLKKYKKSLPKGPFTLAIGTGGNIDAIGRLKLIMLKQGPNTQVTQLELNRIYQKFSKTKPSLRAELFQLRPDRLDVIGPAMFLTLRLMQIYKIDRLKIPGTGLKEGAILSLL